MTELAGAVYDRTRNVALAATEVRDDAPIAFIDLKAQHERISSEIAARLVEVAESGRYIMGPFVEDLERRLADYTGARHALGVSSGTDALLIPLMARGIGPGDAVFMPSFTFTATAEVAVQAGATPVFVDVHPDSFNISADDLEAKIAATLATGRLRPAAVLAVDLYGLPADYPKVNALAARHDMLVIADSAQSFGGRLDNRRVGSLATVTATSFYPSKPLGCYGDGGAVFTDDDALAEIMRSVRSHGQGEDRYDTVRIGVNGRLDAIQAAVLRVKLDIFDHELDRRGWAADTYDERLRGLVGTPWRSPASRSAWAQYTIKVEDRDRLAEFLKGRGIPTMVYYPKPMHLQPAYDRFGGGAGSLPVSERLCGEVLSLPFHPYLTEAQIDRVADAIADFYGR
jgi:dTDP-4-amino-4,6-dideoxygalactose transaminase